SRGRGRTRSRGYGWSAAWLSLASQIMDARPPVNASLDGLGLRRRRLGRGRLRIGLERRRLGRRRDLLALVVDDREAELLPDQDPLVEDRAVGVAALAELVD